jgi:O-antigen chain-terminating methyltransferase
MNDQEMPLADRSEPDLEQIIEIHDPEIDVEQVMARIRENLARRRAEGAYQEDLDTIADEVFAGVVSARPGDEIRPEMLAATLSELESHWMIREQPFTSHVPVVGPLIVAVRNLWNWMSTKWYVQPLLHQQLEFNALAARAFLEMSAEHQVLAERVRQLEKVSTEQGKEIRLLREQIKSLQGPGSSPGDLEW